MSYGIFDWGRNTTHLFKLKKKAVRIVANSKYNDDTEPLFKSLGIPKLDNVFKQSVLKFYYSYCHVSLPLYFQSSDLNLRAEYHIITTSDQINCFTLIKLEP